MSSKIEPKFLFRFLTSEEGQSRILANFKGSAQGGINTSFAPNTEVPLAPLNEQRRIVEKLDRLLAKVESARARLERVPAILKRFRQAVLAAAVSGELTKDWRERNGGVENVESELRELGVPVQEGGIEKRLPLKWRHVKLGDYVNNHDSQRIPVSSKEREKRTGDYPYYGASGIIDYIDGYTHDGEFVLIGEDGANLLARSKNIAFLAKGKIWVNNHAHVLSCKDSFPNEFLSIFINSIDLAPYVTGSAQPKLSQQNLNRIPVPVPPQKEQKEIVRRVEALFKIAEQVEARYVTAKSHVDKLSQSILAKAFRGELVPQDPNDELAEKLLER